jgi:hypothetical protein
MNLDEADHRLDQWLVTDTDQDVVTMLKGPTPPAFA